MVSLQEAKLVGDRIYLFILLADAAGEAEIEVLKADTARASQDPRRAGMGPSRPPHPGGGECQDRDYFWLFV